MSADRTSGGAPEPALLTYCDRAGQVREVCLEAEGSRFTVGRSSSADISLPQDATVSRLHAAFEMIGGRVTVVDQSLSLNGTFVNGARVNGYRALNSGDVVRIGDTEFVYEANSIAGQRTHAGGSGDLAVRVTLTTVQRRVLTELCRPFQRTTYATPASNQQIADRLGIAVTTVKAHIRTLFDKFGVNELPNDDKRRQLVIRAMSSGLIAAEERSEPTKPVQTLDPGLT